MIDRNSLYAKNGFSLLELLLAISVIAALFTGVAVAFSNWAERSVDRSVSREIQELQNAAREYVRLNLENIIVAIVSRSKRMLEGDNFLHIAIYSKCNLMI